MKSLEYKEGDLVMTKSKAKLDQHGMKLGTIVVITSKMAMVLDAQGLIHTVELHELYAYQQI